MFGDLGACYDGIHGQQTIILMKKIDFKLVIVLAIALIVPAINAVNSFRSPQKGAEAHALYEAACDCQLNVRPDEFRLYVGHQGNDALVIEGNGDTSRLHVGRWVPAPAGTRPILVKPVWSGMGQPEWIGFE